MMSKRSLLNTILLVSLVQTRGYYVPNTDDVDLTTVELAKKEGYPIEVYGDVPTEDGYLLEIHRIPHGKSSLNPTKRIPVLLMHGLQRNSRDFVCMGPEKGLAYLLAERGYDVWMGNSRSSMYSRKHQTLNPDVDRIFWDFSWHEIGAYDIPAMFELMKNVTKKEFFTYIGISQGTTEFYVFASVRPEYNRNVSLMISLAPIVYHEHTNLLVKFISIFEPFGTTLSDAVGIKESVTPPLLFLAQAALRTFCAREGFWQDFCAGILMLGVGYDPVQFNKTTIPQIAGIGLGGSVRESLHYAQNIRSGYFRPYDFGTEGNLKKYGSVYPPSYNLSKITAPVALFYSEGDGFAQPADVHRLCRELSNCVYEYKVRFKYFNHLDFLIANDVVKLVFRKVFQILAKYD